MKTKFYFLFFITFISKSFSQIQFEKGYFINNSDQKIECLIKNVDWLDNPVNFHYKLDENAKIETQDISAVKEFGISKWSRFVRNTVDVDISSEIAGNISYKKEPEFVKQTVFLKLLVEGKTNLYSYVNGNITRFFYNKENNEIIPLVFKSYMDNENYIRENIYFKQQILNELSCSNIKKNEIEALKYLKNDLVAIFLKYNQCYGIEKKDNDLVDYTKKEKRDFFNLNLRLHFNNASLSAQNKGLDLLIDYGKQFNIGFGLEAEYILPFNKNKWSVVLEPSYQNYKSKQVANLTNDFSSYSFKMNSSVEYSSIGLPLSLRYYVFLNNKSKLFFNLAYMTEFQLNSKITNVIEEFSSTSELDISSRDNYAFGVGYKFKNKFIIELRSHTSKNILREYGSWIGNYDKLSLIIGYSIF